MIGVIQNMHRNFISHHWIKSYGEKYTEKLYVALLISKDIKTKKGKPKEKQHDQRIKGRR